MPLTVGSTVMPSRPEQWCEQTDFGCGGLRISCEVNTTAAELRGSNRRSIFSFSATGRNIGSEATCGKLRDTQKRPGATD